MKIGIVTCWQPDDNYGTQIQCFALQKYLCSLGHDAFLIRYKRFEDLVKVKLAYTRYLKLFNPYIVVRHIYHSLISKRSLKETKAHDRLAPQFREKYLNMTRIYDSYLDLASDPPQADLYIVGSDQVWNINNEQCNNIRAHFLDFGNESTVRIAYAASFGFGLDKLDTQYARTIFPLLQKFSGISVRERSAISICNKIAEVNGCNSLPAIQVCDPTLLLEKNFYLNYFQNEKFDFNEDNYILVYNIMAYSELNINEIKKWAEINNLKLVYVMGHGKTSKIPHVYPTVPQWLNLIANAKYVITNSFHGTVFSLLFHKNCAVYPIKIPTNSRLETLVELIEQNIIVERGESFEEKLYLNIDWDRFETKKNKLKQIGVDYLNQFLN